MNTHITREQAWRLTLPIIAVTATRFALMVLCTYGLVHWSGGEAALVVIVALAAFSLLHGYARDLRWRAAWAVHALTTLKKR